MYNETVDPGVAAGTGFGIVFLFVGAALYFYFAFTQYKMAQKCNHEDTAWWAFIPIMNTVLLWKMSQKEWYWFLFFFIPVLNIVSFFVVWAEVAKRLGHSAMWGAFVMLPVLNFVAVYILAFSEGENSAPQAPPAQADYSEPRTPTHV